MMCLIEIVHLQGFDLLACLDVPTAKTVEMLHHYQLL